MAVTLNTADLGTEVAIGSIEKELKKLWEADEARTNASLINFAVYSEDSNALSVNSESVREITREHACRAILIGIDRDCEETSIRAWITAHCHLAHGRKSVCSEQLAFHLTGKAIGRLRNTVFAHLNSDLPLVFWWQGELSERFNERLYSLIDRLVVDSSQWSDPLQQFRLIQSAMKDGPLIVQDLSWTRTYHFRLAIAALYDDPMLQDTLLGIQKISITCHPRNRTSGLQLLAWMAVQAGWKLTKDLVSDGCANSYRFEKSNGELLDACLVLDENSAQVGELLIKSPSAEVRVSRDPNSNLVGQHVKMEGHSLDRHAPADSQNIVELVADQLSRGGKNSLFRKILPQFMELLGN